MAGPDSSRNAANPPITHNNGRERTTISQTRPNGGLVAESRQKVPNSPKHGSGPGRGPPFHGLDLDVDDAHVERAVRRLEGDGVADGGADQGLTQG